MNELLIFRIFATILLSQSMVLKTSKKEEKVLLIFPKITESNFPKKVPFELPYHGLRPPLGIMYVISVLKEMNISTIVIDERIQKFSPQKLWDIVQKEKPLFVGFYSDYFSRNKIVNYISLLRVHTSIPIVIGGPGHFHYEEFLKAGANVVIHGESEITLPSIVEALRENSSPEGIKNVSYKKNSEMIKYERYVLPTDLDALPFPDRESLPIEKYQDIYVPLLLPPSTTIITSRGCPYNCAFCTVPFLCERKLRIRSVENVIEEIKYLKKKFDINYIIFEDDSFGIYKNWLVKFCESLLKLNFKINWMCILHPSVLGKEKKELASLMIKAGCNTVVIGVQTPLKEILTKLNRNPEEVEEAVETISIFRKEAMVVVEFIIGFSEDIFAETKEISKFLKITQPHLAKFHPLIIFPYSQLAEEVGKTFFPPTPEKRLFYSRKLYMRYYLRDFPHTYKTVSFIWKRNKRWFFRFIKGAIRKNANL